MMCCSSRPLALACAVLSPKMLCPVLCLVSLSWKPRSSSEFLQHLGKVSCPLELCPCPWIARGHPWLISVWSPVSLRIYSGLCWILGGLFTVALETGVRKRGFGFPPQGTLAGCVLCAHALICKYILGKPYGENRAGAGCRVTRGDIILHQWSKYRGAEEDTRDKDSKDKARDASVESFSCSSGGDGLGLRRTAEIWR